MHSLQKSRPPISDWLKKHWRFRQQHWAVKRWSTVYYQRRASQQRSVFALSAIKERLIQRVIYPDTGPGLNQQTAENNMRHHAAVLQGQIFALRFELEVKIAAMFPSRTLTIGHYEQTKKCIFDAEKNWGNFLILYVHRWSKRYCRWFSDEWGGQGKSPAVAIHYDRVDWLIASVKLLSQIDSWLIWGGEGFKSQGL